MQPDQSLSVHTQNIAPEHMTGKIMASWFCRVVAAGILAQSALYKFIGIDISISVLQRLGVEPWGKYVTGGIEGFAAIALLVPATAWIGAFTALAVMTGALAAYIFVVVYSTDTGFVHEPPFVLFAMALLVAMCAGITAVLHRRDLPFGPWKHYASDPTQDSDVQPAQPPAVRQRMYPARM